jgi:type III pantothenate kinase
VGTEHLLLGLLRERDGVAAQVLMNLGLQLNEVHQEVLNLLGHGLDSPSAPLITKRSIVEASLVAVDIGNSGIKFGQFVRGGDFETVAEGMRSAGERSLPEPIATFELPIAHNTGLFDLQKLAVWCELNLSTTTHWSIASVHRGAGDLLAATIAAWAKHLGIDWPIRRLTYQDVPLEIRLEEPARVGIDRLLAAMAANRLREPDRAAIIVDLGTAITVDLLEADGGFAGGAILPGIAMAGRALAEQTDALPHVVLEHREKPPTPLGKSTVAAIEAGLYWGTVGAVGELVARLAAGLPAAPEFFITGGASRSVADSLGDQSRVRYVPHLVLAGIALVHGRTPGGAGG